MRLQRVLDLLIGAIIKRREQGRADGVAVLAEGLIEILDPHDLGGLEHVERRARSHTHDRSGYGRGLASGTDEAASRAGAIHDLCGEERRI